jgi:hypothetical protein
LEFLTETKKKEQANKFFGGHFTSDNEPDGIENATHNTLWKIAGYFNFNIRLFLGMYCGLHYYYYHS